MMMVINNCVDSKVSTPSVNTVYRTEASDSFCFKFLDGVCTTVIEVNMQSILIQSHQQHQNIQFCKVKIVMQVISVVAFYGAWGTGKWYFGARTEDE